MKRRILVMFAAVMFLGLPVEAIVLAENGRTDYEIVRSDSMGGEMQEWTAFLRSTLRQITGVDFRVVFASQHTEGTPAIFVAPPVEGGTKYEEYIVRTQGKDLILAGHGDRGPQLAIRYFLTRMCGCRWYDSWTRKIPTKRVLEIPEISLRRTPSFFFRRIFQGCGWGTDPAWKPGLYGMPRMSANPIGRPKDVHSFYDFSKDWPKDRLDLLSMSPKGKRRPLTNDMGPNFCMTNPEVRQRIKKTLRGFIERDRKDAAARNQEAPIIYCLSHNDCQSYYCKCPKCVEFENAHGAGGLLLDFVNEIARDIAPDYPDIVLMTDAYAFAEEPAKGGMKAEDNVLVEIARTKQNYYSAAEDDTDEKFVGYLKGWSKIARQLGVWDYWVFYWDAFPAPYHNVPFIKRNLKWYHDMGVRVVRMESEQPNTASFRTLKEWLGGELMIDVDQDDGELINEFMPDFYGEAASDMKEFMDLLTELQKGQVGKVFAKEGEYDPSKKLDTPRRKWLDADFYAKAEEIFNRAEAKVANADEQTRLNVMRERVPVDLSLLYVYDIVKPGISREDLERRYLANREAQYRLRVAPEILSTALARIRNEVTGLVKKEKAEEKLVPVEKKEERVPEPRKETALENGGKRLDFDLTTLVVQPNEKGVKIEWTCRESNMGNVHARYDGGDWNVFSGDAVDFYFSAYQPNAKQDMTRSQYRFMMNPAGTTLTAYDDSKWRSRSIVSKVSLLADCWKSEWTIPYAALATYGVQNQELSVVPTRNWLFNVNRSRTTTGVHELLAGGALRIELPEKFIEPYSRVAIDKCKVEAGAKDGEVCIKAKLKEMQGRGFSGKVKFLLYVGANRTVVGTQEIRLSGGAERELTQDVVLPMGSERFSAAVAVADEDSRCVRISRDVPVENPWVE